MTIYRSELEFLLLKRAKSKMALVDMDVETHDGTNQDMTEPLSSALLQMGVTPENLTDVTDSDLAGVDNDQLAELLDRAELRLLQNIGGNLTFVDVTIGPRRESLSQLSGFVSKAIENLQARIDSLYGAGNVEVGVINLNFAEDGTNEY